MNKVVLALSLGLVSFLVLMVIGETFGALAMFVSLAVYFFFCQVLLSRGNPDALRKDWRIMLALNAVMLIVNVIMSLVEKREVVFSHAPGILLASCGGTLAGALVASWAARRAMAKS